jgi:long-chain acyl-CoA synthetase
VVKRLLVALSLPTSFIDNTIFKKVKEVTGGRLKLALSGGAPIAEETHILLCTVLCPILQGYGLTETCGTVSVQGMSEVGIAGSVGSPFSCVEVKLVASGSYDPNPTNGSPPCGEIWARGGNIMKGYYNEPEKTAESVTSDGWFMTGDIGEWLTMK